MTKGNLNFKFVITHLTGCILLMLGFRQFAFLTKYTITKNLSTYGVREVVRSTNTPDMMGLFEWLFIASVLAFHISLIISLMVTLKKKLPLVNLYIVFALSLFALCIQFIRFETILNVRISIGSFFHGSWFAFKYIVPGVLFIILGLITFFNPWTNKSSKKKPAPKPAKVKKMPEPVVRWGL